MPVPVTLELEWRGQRYRDVERGLKVLATDLDQDLNLAFRPIARKVLRDYMRGVLSGVRERISTPYPDGTSPAGQFPGTLSRRSGRLLDTFRDDRIDVEDGPDDVSVSFTLDGIAAVHERGAVIRAVNAQYLTIPLPAALNRNGTPKRPTARSWPNTFVQRSRKGNLLIFQKKGDGIVPLYALKKSVVIPKRLAFRESFEAGRSLLADTLANEIVKEFTNA